MAGGGSPTKTGINWSAAGIAFQLLMVIIAGLMAYAYVNGGTASRIDRIEADLRDKASKQEIAQNRAAQDAQIGQIEARLNRLESRRR
jgi:hypothetical protein